MQRRPLRIKRHAAMVYNRRLP